MTGPATPQAGSQELADRVREKLLRSMSVTDAHLYTHADLDDALAALDALAARLQATEQALRPLAHPFSYGEPDWEKVKFTNAEIDCCVSITFDDVLAARRALEGAAE